MIKNLLLSILILILFYSCTNQNNAENVRLELNLDQDYKQVLVFETKTNSNDMGSMEEINEVEYTLDSITSDGVYCIKAKINRIKYQSTLFGETENYDSDNNKSLAEMTDSEKEIHAEVSPMLNNEYHFRINSKAELLDVASSDQEYMADYLTKDLTNCPAVFPDEEVYVGYQWSNEKNNPILESQKIKSNYTISSIDDKEIHFEVITEIEGIGGFVDQHTAEGIYVIDRKSKQFIRGIRTMKMQFGGGTVTYKIYQK